MRITNLIKPGLYFIAFGAVCMFSLSCKKNDLKPGSTPAAQSDDQVISAASGGLYASAADTLSSVDNLYFYTSSNNQLQLSMEFKTKAKDGNGVYYNDKTDEIYQLSRKNKTVYVFSNASTMSSTPTPSRSFTDSTLSSGREITYDDKRDILYVANNTDSSVRVYKKFSTLSGNVTGFVLKMQGQPWGISYDKNSNILIVAIDLAAMRLDIFDEPSRLKSGNVNASRSINIADRLNGTFSRIHGVKYNSDNDVLVVSEVGETVAPPIPTPGKPPFDADGGIYIFTAAGAKLASGGTLFADGTIYGSNTTLGNPVDVDTRDVNGKSYIYVAEKANKKLLTFRLNAGNTTPVNFVTTAFSPEDITILN